LAISPVIQHYELWPTPLLDFTASLRVAASFALGFGDESVQAGYLYVIGVSSVRGDLMTLPATPTPRMSANPTLAIRLSSVCPPNAQRPHLQEGYLLGHYPFDEPALDAPRASDASACLIAKIPLRNARGGFWSQDFPPHTKESLLPSADGLRKEVLEALDYRASRGGLVTVRSRL